MRSDVVTGATLALFFGCSKPVTPGVLGDFQPPVGSSTFAACTEANEGQRFALSGFFVLDETTEVQDDTLTVWLHETWNSGEGGGARTPVKLQERKHIVFEVKDLTWKQAGFRRRQGQGVITGVMLETTGGPVALETKVTAVVTVRGNRLFGQKALFGCELEVVELRKP
jgi:hypothetical protein